MNGFGGLLVLSCSFRSSLAVFQGQRVERLQWETPRRRKNCGRKRETWLPASASATTSSLQGHTGGS